MRYTIAVFTLFTLLLAGCGPGPTSPALISSQSPTSTPPVPTASPSLSPPPQYRSIILTGHLGWVSRLAWSPDGKLLASASGDYNVHDTTARLWKADGTPLAVLSAHTAEVYALAWSPDGKILATGGGDGTVRLWRPDGTLSKTLTSVGTVFGLSWSPDGKILASGSSLYPGKQTVQFWSADGALLMTRYTDDTGGKFYNVAWSPDGQFIVAGAIDYKLWRRDGSEIFHYTAGTPAWSLAWSPDSRMWAIGDENGKVRLFDISGKLVAQLEDKLGGITSLAWSPNGKLLVGGVGVNVWQNDGTWVTSLAKGSSSVTSVAWSPDGKMFAVGSEHNYAIGRTETDRTVRIWDASLHLMATLSGHTDDILAVAWSPDGKILASGSMDKTIRLWLVQ